MLFKIESYSYNPQDVEILKADAFLHIEPLDYQPLNIREYFKMRKSLKLLEVIEKAEGLPPGLKPEHEAKAKAKYPPGTRWITIHPQGREKGVPVLIRDYGDGTAHVIGGAGGKLNMMKLSNIKSPEEYKQKVEARKEAERGKKEAVKEEEKKYAEKLTKEERKKYKEAKKLKKQEKKIKELTIKEKKVEAEKEFVNEVADALGWELEPIEEHYNDQKLALIGETKDLDPEDPLYEQNQKELGLLEKAKNRALKSQRKNIIAQTKEITRKFQRDMVDDTELRQEVERKIEEPSQAGEVIKTEIGGKGKGFRGEYREYAEKRGELTEAKLKERKSEEFEKRMEQIADEISPKTANFIRAGIKTNKNINGIKKTLYEEKEEYETKIKDVDTKTDILKKYLTMEHKLDEIEEETKGVKEVQATLDGTPEEQVAEKVNDLKYGNGVKLDWMPSSEDLARSLMEEEERLQAERQSALNGSFLKEIEKNKDGAEKWIANGNYNGFNSISLAVLKHEGLNRDTVDLLGIGSSAELLATLIRRNTSPEDYQDIAQGMEAYHDEINEGIVKEALEQGQELLNRAETIKEEIANNPNDLAVLNELNEARLQYLDKANQIMGQALGSLEASAAMAATLKKGEDPERIDTNLGRIATEEAIVRMRALGLQKEDYEIHSIAGNKIITIGRDSIDKLINNIDRQEVRLQNEIEAIKAGTEDQKGWLPDGVVFRPESSFQDPETRDLTVAQSFASTDDLNADVNRMVSERIADGMLVQDIVGDLLSPETLRRVSSDQMPQYSSVMKDLGIMGTGKKDYSIVERKMNGIAEDHLRDDPRFKDKHIDFQSLPANKDTTEAIHRSLGAVPEGGFAFKDIGDLTSQEMTDVRKYWEKNIYEGTMAQTTAGREFKTGEGKSRTGLWNSFLHENGKSKQSAFEVIKQDLITNHITEDMFGTQEIPPLAKVKERDWNTYRQNVTGANDLFTEIENIETDLEQGFIEDKEQARSIIEEKRAGLPDKLTELYESQMRDHYIKYMSGATEAELEGGEIRREQTAWGEYVRMHGDTQRAQKAILDKVKGDFLKEYADNHGRVHGEPIKTGVKKIANWQDHVLGTLDKEVRDNILNKVQAEMQSATAKVAERKGGKFAAGARRDRALQMLEEIRKQDQAQLGLFGEEEIKQDDGSEIITIGKRAEAELKSLIPGIATNFRRGEKVKVFAGMSMSSDKHIQQQRAIKMFEKAKRINISFGTGKGKSIVSIGAFTNLKSKGKVSRAIYAVPSVVQAQFGGEMLKYTEPGKYNWNANPGMSREERIAALKDNKLDMAVFTHQSLRDDMTHLLSSHINKSENETKTYFNSISSAKRKSLMKEVMDKEGIESDIMLVVDESHYTTKRKGKPDSTLANILDAMNQNTSYFMNQSATPVKNDASEAFDMLKKIDPKKFNDQTEFMKRYGIDSSFTKESLRRLISRYNYASPTVTGVRRNEKKETVQLSKEQQKAYQQVEGAFKNAQKAHRAGKVDIDAMKLLSPNSFKGVSPEKHENITRRLQESAGIIKEEALNRAVNQHSHQTNAKIQKVLSLMSGKVYMKDHPASGAKAGDLQPGVVFAHNIESINQIQKALGEYGVKVGVIQGSLSGKEKDVVKNAFNPSDPKDRKYDVLLCSDAGATGLNLQNAKYLINYDLPHTSWVREQRMGRIDRHGQLHEDIDYHDIVTDTEHEKTKWDRIQRKAELGSIFQLDSGNLDDVGLAGQIEKAKKDRYNQGMKRKIEEMEYLLT